ncbi:MAG: hypothetical protein HY904_12270 [Deltaproteobacteria bacterium]|nr:hypothetical protein [Deltaproteobacteria bacterium]
MDSPLFRRRAFLGACAGAGGLLFMGGALAWLRGSAPAVDGLLALTPQEHRTLVALCRALFPATPEFPHNADDADLARRFDLFLADEPPWNREDLKKALFLLEFSPVLAFRVSTFSRLDEPARLLHFASWQRSRVLLLRQAAAGFLRILSLMFYDDRAAWPAIGYEGPIHRAVTP